jgi:hypothetical protein
MLELALPNAMIYSYLGRPLGVLQLPPKSFHEPRTGRRSYVPLGLNSFVDRSHLDRALPAQASRRSVPDAVPEPPALRSRSNRHFLAWEALAIQMGPSLNPFRHKAPA